MEVRGGGGYIEEWGDARRVRAAMLGSIWEGASNIVALDVLRAIRRDNALDALTTHLRALLAETPMHTQVQPVFEHTLQRVAETAAAVAGSGERGETLARQVTWARYHTTTAPAMAWEAGRTGSSRRTHLAQCELRQRGLPLDRLAIEDEPGWLSAVLDEAGAGPQVGVEAVHLF
jgi:acyl-CoA dehydrogenase